MIPMDVQDIYITENEILYCPLGESHVYLVDDEWAEDAKNLRKICMDFVKVHQLEDFSFSYGHLNFRATTHRIGDVEFFFVLRAFKEEPIVLDQIGLNPKFVQAFRSMYPLWSKNGGMILISGTTGSGKTTTMASMFGDYIAWKKGVGLTVEDPIEKNLKVYEQDGVLIRQLDLNHYGHENPWRSVTQKILRSNPSIIGVGEIRDDASANYAIRLSGMGKLTISTVHGLSVIQTIEAMRRYADSNLTTFANNIGLIVFQRTEKIKGKVVIADFSFLFFGDESDPNRAILRSEKIMQIGSEIDAQSARLQNNLPIIQRR
jgi:Tfp pilus assembly pilus retraction ATPase PilT